MKKPFIALIFVIITHWLSAQNGSLSPEVFLGYPLGNNFARHHQIVDYFKHIFEKNPSQVKLIQYGTTNERRPLLVAVVASPENLARIEEIRTNHLKAIGLLEGKPTGKEVAICWLSYNVHGNESVSSNTVPQVLYDLLDKNNVKSQKILANMVVILDPCINPDGYDRYANWYNQKKGAVFNPSPEAAEHREPWPGGRYNHYLFDLNRDWAWQIQKESQARITLYQQWMPHLHADFHEQGVENPYYFAPASKPFHEDITPWQREFQNILGEYNKKDFDKNGWLYYTRERYDLFYPSYGDTYPTYNGAFGMTYEQGGSGRAGLGYIRREGDTLTLRQRIDHHYSTSFAALEAVADRSEKVTNEFVKYFDNAKNNPAGIYKSYVIKAKGQEGKVAAFANFLRKQDFKFGYADKPLTGIGFSYQDFKEVTFTIEKGDLVMNLYQPRSSLLKILMEAKPALEDSLTYDITSWALPYAYGLKAYALKTKLEPVNQTAEQTPTFLSKDIEKPYAYIARWNSFTDLKLLAILLKNKIQVRVAETPFEIDNMSFASGTLVITRKGNERKEIDFDRTVRGEAAKLGIPLAMVSTGFVSKGSDFGSDNTAFIKAPRIAALTGEGVGATASGEVWHFFDEQIQYPLTMIGTDNFNNIDLKNYDVLIMPDGGYGKLLTEKTLTTLKDWIKAGGKLIAIEGALDNLAGKDGFELKHKEEEKKSTKPEDNLKVYANRDRESVSEETPGSVYKVTMENTHPLAFGFDKTYFSLVLQSSDFQYLKEGWNVGITKENDLVAGFAGQKAKEKIKNSLIFGVQEMGRGSVIYMANNPLFRGFWHQGKLLFGNAIFF